MGLYSVKRKKILLSALSICMVLTLCACSGNAIDKIIDALPPLPTENSAEETQALPTESIPPETEAPAAASPEIEEKYDTYIVRIAGTPYRSEPKTEQVNVLGSLSLGEKVSCLEDDGEFMLIELTDGQQAWCASWYLRAEDPELEAQRAASYLAEKTGTDTFVPIEGEPVYYCTATVLNCRAEPSTTCTILYQIVMGSQVNILGRDGDF